MKLLLHFFHNGYRQLIRHPQARWWVALATVAYLVVPTDFVVDWIPILGQIDDAAIASLLVAEVTPMLLEQLKNRKKAKASASEIVGSLRV